MNRFRWIVIFVALTVAVTHAQDLPTALHLLEQARAALDAATKALTTPPEPPPPPVIQVPPDPGIGLQAALDTSAPGTIIELEQGAVYVGNYVLRKKDGSSPITIRTGGLDLPDARITPAETRLAKLRCRDCLLPVLQADEGAHDVLIDGVEILPNTQYPDRALVLFGLTVNATQSYTSVEQYVSNIHLDRMLIHADPVLGGRVGGRLDGINMKITRSDVRGFVFRGFDSQAIGVVGGPGPLLVENNYLEASGENFMSGGGDPKILNAVPSDITFRGNHVFKPLEWKTKTGSVKNLFELKNARRVLVEGNLFENNWRDAQAGHAIVITVRNQSGGCPWCTVEDVTIRYNVIRNNPDGMAYNILGTDNIYPSQITKRIRIHDNLHDNVRNGWAASGPLEGLEIIHNTWLGILDRFGFLAAKTGTVITGLVVRDNVTPGGIYGIAGENWTPGTPALDKFAPGYLVTNNVIENNIERTISYPPGNFRVPVGQLAPRFDARFVYTPGVGETSSDASPLGADLTELGKRVTW